MNKTKDQLKAIEELRKTLKPATIVYTILRYVSQSGMLRAISLIVIEDNKPIDISWSVAKALGWKLHKKHYGVKVQGCGMDMGFHLVYSLSSVLYPKGFKTSKGYWRNQPLDFDPDGGYALKQKWL